MLLNPNKSTCMIIGSKRRLQNLPELQLKVLGDKIENVKIQNFLDSSLSWKTHVDKVCSKVSPKVHLLKRITRKGITCNNMLYTGVG